MELQHKRTMRQAVQQKIIKNLDTFMNVQVKTICGSSMTKDSAVGESRSKAAATVESVGKAGHENRLAQWLIARMAPSMF